MSPLEFSFPRNKKSSPWINKQTLFWTLDIILESMKQIFERRKIALLPSFQTIFQLTLILRLCCIHLRIAVSVYIQDVFLGFDCSFYATLGTFYFFCLSHRNKYEQYPDKPPWLKWLWVLMFKLEAANKCFASWIQKKLDSLMSSVEAGIFSSEETSLEEVHVWEIQITFLK